MAKASVMCVKPGKIFLELSFVEFENATQKLYCVRARIFAKCIEESLSLTFFYFFLVKMARLTSMALISVPTLI
jgi:hypothetical protein